ncbi:MAG TPA: hypothetical protein VFA99_02860 [Acidobacteriaceae bacterium]|nr:hypothetical protein [Acidobacteriaceae bacterium]
MNLHDSHAASETIDNRIDRALCALRDAQPRSGPNGEMLASRILASLQHRTAPEATNPGGLPFHAVKGWVIARDTARGSARRTTTLALWAATSAAIVTIASLTILHHTGAPPSARIARQGGIAMSWSATNTAPATRAQPSVESRPASTERTLPISRHPERTGVPGERSSFVGVASVAQRRTSVFENARITESPNGASTTRTDAQALADLHAPSHPAPPLPLTPQEKLLLHMLRYGNATQLAELNPMVRAQQDADETTAFKAFFPDPPPLQQPNGDTE